MSRPLRTWSPEESDCKRKPRLTSGRVLWWSTAAAAVEGPWIACGAGRRLLTAPLHVPVSWRGENRAMPPPAKLVFLPPTLPATPIITYSPQNGITVLAKRRPGPPRSFYMNVVYTKMGNGAIYTFSVRKVDFKSVDEIYPLSLYCTYCIRECIFE